MRIDVDASGWTARAEHAGTPYHECAVAMGEIDLLGMRREHQENGH